MTVREFAVRIKEGTPVYIAYTIEEQPTRAAIAYVYDKADGQEYYEQVIRESVFGREEVQEVKQDIYTVNGRLIPYLTLYI